MLQMTRPTGRPKSDRVPLLGWVSAIRVMFSSRDTTIIIRRVYDTIHMGLWALLVAGTCKNLAIMGGALGLYLTGAGRFSVDNWLRNR